MKYSILLVVLLFAINANAQVSPEKDEAAKPNVYIFVDQMPKPGFDLQKYLSENIHYPLSAKVFNKEGRVVVSFVVNEDGSISDCKVVKRLNKKCDKEALRVIRAMPGWKAGMKDGQKVKVRFNLPINFKLE